MSLPGIVHTARSMAYIQRLHAVTAQNLANVDTDAFKAVHLAAHDSTGGGHPIPVEEIDLRQGALRETGRPLDVGLEGAGFLVVGTEQGERLFRGGSLQLDAAGRLIDLHGDPVLGTEGIVVLTGAQAEFRPDGTVVVDGAVAGRLRIVNLEDPTVLRKEGGGRFLAPADAITTPAPTTLVRQGVVEDANLDPLLAMVDLITIQRAYAANADALRAMDQVLGSIANEVGKV